MVMGCVVVMGCGDGVWSVVMECGGDGVWW